MSEIFVGSDGSEPSEHADKDAVGEILSEAVAAKAASYPNVKVLEQLEDRSQ